MTKFVVDSVVVSATMIVVMDKGYVYYFSDGNGRIKIGFSKNPWARAKEMRCANPDIKLVSIELGSMDLERERQAQFKKHHLALEWFKCEGELELFIENLEKRHDLCKKGDLTLVQAGLVKPAPPPQKSKIEELRELVKAEQEKVPEVHVAEAPLIFRDDYGRVISERQWNQLQKRKDDAMKSGYVIDEYSQ